MTYGHEAWDMSEEVCSKVRGWNGRCLAIIKARNGDVTADLIRTETNPETTSFDLLRALRARRCKWLGHILRLAPGRLIHMAVKQLGEDAAAAGDLRRRRT